MPMVNIWCAQTPMLMKAIIVAAATIIGYPKMGLREKTGTISERQAKAGMIRM